MTENECVCVAARVYIWSGVCVWVSTQAKYDSERVAAVESEKSALSSEHKRTLDARRTQLQHECDAKVSELQQEADSQMADTLAVLEREQKAETQAAVGAVRAECGREMVGEVAALEREMSEKRETLLKTVERECEEEMKTETEKMQVLFAASRDERVRTLTAQLHNDTQEHVQQKQLRTELELAREVNALRAECVADMERCRALVEGRNSAAAQKLISLMRLKHRTEADALLTTGDRAARKHKDAVLQELRDEWLRVRGLLDAAAAEMAAGGAVKARECSENDDRILSTALQQALRQVEEVQGLLGVVVQEAASLAANAETAAIATQFAVHQALQQQKRETDAKQSSRSSLPPMAQRIPAAKRTLVYPTSGVYSSGGSVAAAAADGYRKVTAKEEDATWSEELDAEAAANMSMGSTVAANTPAKSLKSSVSSSLSSLPWSTPEQVSSPADAMPLSDWSSPSKNKDTRKDDVVVRNRYGIQVSPIKHAVRLSAQGSPLAEPAQRQRREGGNSVTEAASERGHSVNMHSGGVSIDSLDDMCRSRGKASKSSMKWKGRSTENDDSEDSLESDEQEERQMAGKLPQSDNHSHQASPAQERDRLLFSLLRRTSTRRSLTKLFSASASHASSSV